MLPQVSIDGEKLDYPLGLNDFETITGKRFDFDSYRRVPQFIYMGAQDTNDAVKYDDTYSAKERETIYKILARKMQPDCWNKCQEIYLKDKVNAKFTTYEHMGHGTDSKIVNDIVAFF